MSKIPFGKWPDFQACLTDMQGPPNNYDVETAKKVCGKLQHRLEGKQVFKILKSSTGRRIIEQYVSVEDLDKDFDIIPRHRISESLENLKAMDPRYHNVNWKHSSYQIGHPLWSFKDAEGIEHRTEVDEYGLFGITEIRNDGYQKADEIWDMILKGIPVGASIALRPSAKPILLSKDEIKNRDLNPAWEGAKYWDIPLQAIEPWSLTLSPANQYVTPAVILSKDQGECDVSKCKGACCTFISQWEPELTADLEKYYALHGIEFKEVEKGAWLKLPIPCQSFDSETYLCKSHDSRPDICRFYPRRESPFILKSDCSLLQSRSMPIGQSNLNWDSNVRPSISISDVLKDECASCIEARADWYLRKGYETDYLTAVERAKKWYLEKEKLKEKEKPLKIQPDSPVEEETVEEESESSIVASIKSEMGPWFDDLMRKHGFEGQS